MSTSLLPFPSLSPFPFPSETRIFGDFRFAYLPPPPPSSLLPSEIRHFFGTSDLLTSVPTPRLDLLMENLKFFWDFRFNYSTSNHPHPHLRTLNKELLMENIVETSLLPSRLARVTCISIINSGVFPLIRYFADTLMAHLDCTTATN